VTEPDRTRLHRRDAGHRRVRGATRIAALGGAGAATVFGVVFAQQAAAVSPPPPAPPATAPVSPPSAVPATAVPTTAVPTTAAPTTLRPPVAPPAPVTRTAHPHTRSGGT
jgi:hypothetical protein